MQSSEQTAADAQCSAEGGLEGRGCPRGHPIPKGTPPAQGDSPSPRGTPPAQGGHPIPTLCHAQLTAGADPSCAGVSSLHCFAALLLPPLSLCHLGKLLKPKFCTLSTTQPFGTAQLPSVLHLQFLAEVVFPSRKQQGRETGKPVKGCPCAPVLQPCHQHRAPCHGHTRPSDPREHGEGSRDCQNNLHSLCQGCF